MSKIRYWVRTLKDLMFGINQLKNQYNQFQNSGNDMSSKKTTADTISSKPNEDEVLNEFKATTNEYTLPIAGIKDVDLETEFKQIGQTAIGSSFTIEKIIITASKWGITNDTNGRPICRSMISAAIGKDENGQCYQQFMTFTQPAQGNDFGAIYYDEDWSYSKREIEYAL